MLRDAIGRDWQCGTVQVDLNLPGRLGAFYIDEHSNKVTPVMLHRAMFGSLERFIGILIEHYAGHLPLWLSPLQAVVATITDDADDYAREVVAAAQRVGLRVEADLRNEKINYKVREHSLAKVPVLLVVGQQGSGRAHRVDPPPRQRGPERDAARRRARRPRGRGGRAGCQKDEAGGVGGRVNRVRVPDAVQRAAAQTRRRNLQKPDCTLRSGAPLIRDRHGSERSRVCSATFRFAHAALRPGHPLERIPIGSNCDSHFSGTCANERLRDASGFGQQSRCRLARGFVRAAPWGSQSQRSSGLAGGFGSTKRSSGDGAKR